MPVAVLVFFPDASERERLPSLEQDPKGSPVLPLLAPFVKTIGQHQTAACNQIFLKRRPIPQGFRAHVDNPLALPHLLRPSWLQAPAQRLNHPGLGVRSCTCTVRIMNLDRSRAASVTSTGRP